MEAYRLFGIYENRWGNPDGSHINVGMFYFSNSLILLTETDIL